MNNIHDYLIDLGMNPEKEISKLFKNQTAPEDKNLLVRYKADMDRRREFLDLLIDGGYLMKDLSQSCAVEIGGGTCSTGAVLAEKCKVVISFELEKVHCLFAKECRESNRIENLNIFYGGITGVDGNNLFFIRNNSVDLVVSYMGMFRYTVFDTLGKIPEILKKNGKFICLYPRFWTDSDRLNEVDEELSKRAQKNDTKWVSFKDDLEVKLKNAGLEIQYNDILEGYETAAIGGDVILGSRIASSRQEYIKNPIEGIVFGKTPITCNTLICCKKQ